MDRHHIPERSEFVALNTYNHGCYNAWMLDGEAGKRLSAYHQDWVDACNEKYKTKFTLDDFSVNSGYRPPHHNDYHAGSTAPHGLHQYGFALDVAGVDVNGDEAIDIKDWEMMEVAATDAGANQAYVYTSSGHVHADWRFAYAKPWPPAEPAAYETVDDENEEEVETPIVLPPETAPTPITPPGPCGHTYTAAQADDHEQVTGPCQHTYYRCAETQHATLTCPTDTEANDCLYGSYYVCSPHEHAYPPPTALRCGNTWSGSGACIHGRVVVSSTTEHQENCPLHGTYWGCNQGAADSHGLRACVRCGLSYRNCANSATACQSSYWHTQDGNTSVTGPCGHTYLASAAYNHRSERCPANSAGVSCSYWSYYVCSPHTHVYPEAPPETEPPENDPPPETPPETEPPDESPELLCGNSWSGSGACIYGRVVVSSSTEHQATCSTHGTYWSCNQSAADSHGSRTCTRCALSYQNCTNTSTACQGSRWHTQDAVPVLLCANSWSGTGACIYGRVVASSSTEHQATCSTHGTYWSCNATAEAWHGTSRTCTRTGCGATYTNCVKGDGSCSAGQYIWHSAD